MVNRVNTSLNWLSAIGYLAILTCPSLTTYILICPSLSTYLAVWDERLPSATGAQHFHFVICHLASSVIARSIPWYRHRRTWDGAGCCLANRGLGALCGAKRGISYHGVKITDPEPSKTYEHISSLLGKTHLLGRDQSCLNIVQHRTWHIKHRQHLTPLDGSGTKTNKIGDSTGKNWSSTLIRFHHVYIYTAKTCVVGKVCHCKTLSMSKSVIW